jgi:hypothetical protein
MWAEGIAYMSKREAEDFLFGGSHKLADAATKAGEAWNIVREMIFKNLRHNRADIRYFVTVVTGEKFHRKDGAQSWVRKSRNASFNEIEGTHFGVLLNPHTIGKIIKIFS